MKQLLLLLSIFVLITACQKEIEGLGGNSNNPAAKKCTGCSYLPVCDSTKLTYIDSSAVGVDILTNTQAILGDTTIGGKKFTRVSPFGTFQQGLLYNCDGGNYRVYQPVPDLGIDVDSLFQSLGLPGSVTIPTHIQTTILKTGVAAGATWSDTVFQFSPIPFLTITAKLDYKLEEKGVQRTVLGKTYSNVIHVSSKLAVVIPLGPALPFDVSVNTYYADGVGVIESRTANAGVVQNVTKLKP